MKSKTVNYDRSGRIVQPTRKYAGSPRYTLTAGMAQFFMASMLIGTIAYLIGHM